MSFDIGGMKAGGTSGTTAATTNASAQAKSDRVSELAKQSAAAPLNVQQQQEMNKLVAELAQKMKEDKMNGTQSVKLPPEVKALVDAQPTTTK